MECKTARLFLPLLDDLVGHEAAGALQAHLALCPECDASARAAQREDAHFARAMLDVPVPAGLKSRVLEKLAVGRHTPWREWALRFVRPLTVAAGILFSVSLGLCIFTETRPPADPEDVLRAENFQRLQTAAEADEALARLGLPACAPPDFNYGHLTGQPARACPPGYPDRQVPAFYFVDRTSGLPRQALVYAFKEKHLRPLGPEQQTGFWKVDVYRPAPRDGRDWPYVYLILYNGDHWEDWLKKYE